MMWSPVALAWVLSLLLQISAVPIVGTAADGEGVQEVVVTVPEGAVVGQKLRFQAPGGGSFYEVAVPEGAAAGSELKISVPAAPAAAAAAPPPPLPLPPPPPPPPPPEEPAEELLLAAAPSAVGLVDLTEVPPAATPAAVADDPGAPAATGLLQPDPQSADEGDRAAADAAAAEAAAAADAGEAVSVGLGPARDHPSADESGTAGDADEGSVQLQPAVAMVDRVGAKHYRVLAVPHCSTKTDAPATQFRTREREPARQPSALRFCWDETHLQLASAVLSDGDIVGRGRQRCAGAMSEFDGGDVIRLSLSSGPDLPSRWIALSISAAGGLAIARVEAGGEVEKAFDCTGSGTHVAESRVISSVMLGKSCCCCTSDAIAIISCAVLAWLLSQLILLACSGCCRCVRFATATKGGNEADASAVYGMDEDEASQHTMDVSVENRTDAAQGTASAVGWRVTARLPWRLLQGGGGLFAGEDDVAGSAALVSPQNANSPSLPCIRYQPTLRCIR